MQHHTNLHHARGGRLWVSLVLTIMLLASVLPAAPAVHAAPAGQEPAPAAAAAPSGSQPAAAALSVVKRILAPANRNVFLLGETVTFEITVTNTGGPESIAFLPLTDTFDDSCLEFQPKADPDASSVQGNTIIWNNLTLPNGRFLGPGESFVTTVNFLVVGPTGTGLNTATVSGARDTNNAIVQPNPASSQVSFTCATPGIDLVKVASPTVVLPGGVVGYSYFVSNTGTAPLSGVTVSDDKCSPIQGPNPAGDVNNNGLLDPGEVWQYLCTTPVNTPTLNTAVATGQPSDDNGQPLPGVPPVSDQDTAFVNVVNPAINVVKNASATTIYANGFVTYIYTVTNPGDTPLRSVSVTDDKCAPLVLLSGDVDNDGLLDPGETWLYSCSTNLPVDTTNTVTAAGQPSNNAGQPLPGLAPVVDQDTRFVNVINPAIRIQKTPSATLVSPGASVTYTYVVTNPGDDPLRNVQVTDDTCSPVTPTLFGGFNVGDLDQDNQLDPGEQWVYTCTMALFDDTTNTATATGRDSLNNPVSHTTTAFVDVFVTGLQLQKSASAPVVYGGSSVTYTYIATNGGSDPVSNVQVTDDSCAPVTYVGGDVDNDNRLDPGETWTFTCTTTLFVDTTNVATLSGRDPLGNPVPGDQSSATVDVINPAMRVDKSADQTQILPGGTVVYTYLVTNPGDAPVSNVAVSDDRCSPVTAVQLGGFNVGDLNQNNQLDPGETWRFTCTTTLSVDTTNTATATGRDPLGGPVTGSDTEFVDVLTPGIQVVKTANATTVVAGSFVQYQYQVTNTGQMPLSSVSVGDNRCAPVLGPYGDNGNGLLDVGETWTYLCTAAISADTTNTATATGQPSTPGGAPLPGFPPVSDTDQATVDAINPALRLVKSANDTLVYSGDTVVYTYFVTNTGDTPLTSVSVTDDKCSPVTPVPPAGNNVGDVNNNGLLDPGETWRFTCSAQLTADTTNTAVATGRPSDGNGNPLPGIPPVQARDTETVRVIRPAINVEKSANPTIVSPPPQLVTYTYVVTNPGNDPLSSVTVTDDTCVAPVYQTGDDGNGLLDPGEVWLYICTATVVSDTVNTATAAGNDSQGNPVTDTDRAFVDAVVPGIEVDKFASDTTVYVNGSVTYTYLVRNTTAPPAPIANVVVSDDSCAPVLPASTTNPPFNDGDLNGNNLLDPGEVWQFTCTAALTQDTTNIATATGIDTGTGRPVQDQAAADVDVIDPAIAIEKTASTPAAAVGDTVVYTYAVTNPGDDPLSNVTVVDDVCSPASYVSGDTSGDGLLDPGETWIFTCTYTVQAGDPDPLVNTADATGDDSLGNLVGPAIDTAEVDLVAPRIQVVKTADPTAVLSGGLVVYTYAVTNTGDVPLSGVSVVDSPPCAPIYGPDPTGDANSNGLLDPGETWNYFCVQSIPNDVTNTVTASGQPTAPNGQPLPLPRVDDTDQATVNVVGPQINVAKSASDTVVYPGDTVIYTYLVSNPGDTPLANVAVSDDKCGPITPVPPSGNNIGDVNNNGLLDPGETWTFTCSTPVAVDTVNTATAVGRPTDPAGNPLPVPPVRDQDSEAVNVIDPRLDLDKVPSATVVNPGDSVTYTYYVRNSGDDPLTNVQVTDNKCSPVTPVPPLGNNVGDLNNNGLLDPGEVWVYTCTTTLTQDTLNTATVTARDSRNNPVSDTDRAFVDVVLAGLLLEKVASTTIGRNPTTVTYTYTVTNSGSDPISNVQVTDDKCSPVTYVSGDVNNNGRLDPGEVWTYTCTTTLTQDTVNVAAVTGLDPLNQPVGPAGASASVNIINPAIRVVKTANPTVTLPGGSVLYTYAVTNPGDDPLSNVQVTDDRCTSPQPVLFAGFNVGDLNQDNRLDPGETWQYTCSTTVNNDTTNTATATGVDSLGGVVRDTDTAFVDVVRPGILVEKSANPTVVVAGGFVVYTYLVSNTGDVPLTNVTVGDDTCAPVVYASGDANNNGLLDTNETWTFTCTAQIFVDTTNTATAAGQPSTPNGAPLPGIPPVTDTDQETVRVTSTGIILIKTPSAAVVRPGDTVVYTFEVTNTGTTPLTQVSVSDNRCSPVTPVLSGSFNVGDVNTNGLLDPGETWRYTCSTTLTVDTTNTAVATGRPSDGNGNPLPGIPPVTDDDTATVDVIRPAIDLVKTANPTSAVIGQQVLYTYQVTNTGDDPLTSVTVTDNKCSPVTYQSGDNNSNGRLDPGETWTFTCTYTVQLTDPDPLVNTATAQGLDSLNAPVRDTDQASVDLINGSIGDDVWLDVNGDGIRQPGEQGIYNVGITLTWAGPNGILGDGDDQTFTTTTDVQGKYLFTNLLPGLYRVDVDQNSPTLTGLVLTYPLSGEPVNVTLSAGQNRLDVDFGYQGSTAVRVLTFEAAARPAAVSLGWRVLLNGEAAPRFHVLRSRLGQPWQRLTTTPVSARQSDGQVATYAFVDRTPRGGSYLYFLQDEQGQIFGPWQVRVPSGKLFLPVVVVK